jgi:multisubunit Na+/H+ antiporter MnhB subunit
MPVNPIPSLVRKLAYAGLIPFIGLALLVQLAPTPLNYLSAESLAGYGAVITAFMGAMHWGANLHTLGKAPSGDRWIDRNAWIWGVIPALVAWLALHIYIPVGLLILASTLIIQRNIDQNTYRYYFSDEAACTAFMTIRNRLTYIAAACLTWAAIVILFIQA